MRGDDFPCDCEAQAKANIPCRKKWIERALGRFSGKARTVVLNFQVQPMAPIPTRFDLGADVHFRLGRICLKRIEDDFGEGMFEGGTIS